MPKLKKQKKYSVMRSITLWQRAFIRAKNLDDVKHVLARDVDNGVEWQTFDESEWEPIISEQK